LFTPFNSPFLTYYSLFAQLFLFPCLSTPSFRFVRPFITLIFFTFLSHFIPVCTNFRSLSSCPHLSRHFFLSFNHFYFSVLYSTFFCPLLYIFLSNTVNFSLLFITFFCPVKYIFLSYTCTVHFLIFLLFFPILYRYLPTVQYIPQSF
jgi:hypothetical protein